MSHTHKAYFVVSATGCTCCNNENMMFGPYRDVAAAKTRRDRNQSTKRFASQYAANGRHDIYTSQAELLPDGRLIIGATVFVNWADDTLDDEIGHPDRHFYSLGEMEHVKDA